MDGMLVADDVSLGGQDARRVGRSLAKAFLSGRQGGEQELFDIPLPKGGKALLGPSGFLGLVMPGRNGRPVLIDLGEQDEGFRAAYGDPFREAGWPVIDIGDARTRRLFAESEDCEAADLVEHVLRTRGALRSALDVLDVRLRAEPEPAALPAFR